MLPRENFQPIHQHPHPPQGMGIGRGAVRFSIENARLQFKQREFSESILNYIAVLKNQPNDIRLKYLPEYLDSLRAYLYEEINDSHIKDILQISSSIYGTEFRFLRLEAEHHFQRGKLLKSLEVFKKSKHFAKNNLERVQASTSVENIRSQLFDAWHWRMINDAKRNEKFAAAIEAAIEKKPEAFVIDIGCGSGIFSVIATRLYENPTIACDQNEVMCRIARETFDLNAVEVELFEKHSSKLLLPAPCDILITETVDSGIFGERIVDTVLDAKERLLSHDAIVIPSKATALFSLLQSEDIARENLFESDSFALISNCCNLPELEGRRIIPPSAYNCSHLNELPNGYRLLSVPIEGMGIDFNNIHQLRRIKNDQFLTEVVIRATEKGLANAICVWFRLNLFAEHEICTGPEEGHSWQQAIFPFYPPLEVCPGYTIRFEVFIKGNALHVQPIGTPEMAVTKEVLRAPLWMDFMAMNDKQNRLFFRNAANPIIYSQIMDCTDFLLGDDFTIASAQSVIRYIDRNALNLDKAVCEPGGAILFWPFSNQGSLVDDYMTSIIELRARSPYTTLIPCQILLKGCLISSPQLCKWSRLLDDPEEFETTYCGVDLAKMDEYRVTHFHEVQTRTLPFEQMSEDVEIFNLNFQNEKEEQVSNYVKQLTKADQNECIFTCNKEGNCHAILYWFEIVDPSGNRLDLRRQTESHLPSAYILAKPKNLKTGNQLKAQFSLLHGNVMFHWVKDVLFL